MAGRSRPVSSSWENRVDQLDKIRDPAALPGWLAIVTQRECLRVLGTTRGPWAAGYVVGAEITADKQSGPAGQELLAAGHHAALREAFAALPPSGQRLIALLLEDPPVPDAEISARLGIPVSSIGPTRSRCLDKLRHYPAVAALAPLHEHGGPRLRLRVLAGQHVPLIRDNVIPVV